MYLLQDTLLKKHLEKFLKKPKSSFQITKHSLRINFELTQLYQFSELKLYQEIYKTYTCIDYYTNDNSQKGSY